MAMQTIASAGDAKSTWPFVLILQTHEKKPDHPSQRSIPNDAAALTEKVTDRMNSKASMRKRLFSRPEFVDTDSTG
jgi:hypothetical protein